MPDRPKQRKNAVRDAKRILSYIWLFFFNMPHNLREFFIVGPPQRLILEDWMVPDKRECFFNMEERREIITKMPSNPRCERVVRH